MTAPLDRPRAVDPIVRAIAPRALAVLLMPFVAGGALTWATSAWLGLPVAAALVGWVAWALRPLRRGEPPSEKPALVLRMTRAEEPELFAAFDEVARQIGVRPLDSVEIIPEANAYALHDGDADIVALGMPLLAMNFRWELLATYAHELGHVHAGDTRTASFRAMRALTLVYLDSPSSLMRKLTEGTVVRAVPHFHAERQRQERRADAWSAYVVGRGAVARSLRVDRQIEEIWRILMHQAARLAAAGERVDNLFSFARAAWNEADRKQLLAFLQRELDAQPDEETTTHPTLLDRAFHAEKQVERLTHEPPKIDVTARTMLQNAEDAERAWTAAIFAHFAGKPAHTLSLLADRHALARSVALDVRDGRALLAQRAGQVAIEDLPMSARLQIIFESAVSKKRREQMWLVPLRVGAVERTVEVKPFTLERMDAYDCLRALVSEAVHALALEGVDRFGLPGSVKVREREWLSRDLCATLADGGGPWQELLEDLRRWDRLEKTDPRAKMLLPDWRAKERAPR